MPKSHAPYPQEYRQQIPELAQAGRSAEELAKEFEPSAQCIRNWIKQAEVDRGQRRDGLTSEERAELVRLRRENKQLKLEREILAKAAIPIMAASTPPLPLVAAAAKPASVPRWPRSAIASTMLFAKASSHP